MQINANYLLGFQMAMLKKWYYLSKDYSNLELCKKHIINFMSRLTKPGERKEKELVDPFKCSHL